MPPPNWPSNVRYITSCTIHASVPHDTRKFLEEEKPVSKTPLNTQSSVKIRRISESTHPACGQLGLFAARKIPAKTHIVDYIGEIHCDEREDSDYDLSLFRDGNGNSVGIDASKMGNEGRFVNDYRGIEGQDKPNAVFVDDRTGGGRLKMRIESSRTIKKGEEILVSYGKAWWLARRK
ncbi:SET domain protein [Mycena rosella]|uniref:SET domain protein n=1 Tax=Mycena rosella TaxID=1033263 RepID=A0AAD7CW69_MYCRO|nr:SET domain protein [Mycena rosella]